MKLFLIRHGESVWNRRNIVQGLGDPGLSAEGKYQAEQAAKVLADKKINLIYTSPLLRARQTAQAIALACDSQIKELDNLREITLGVWEGKSFEEISRLFKKQYQIWCKYPSKTKIKNAEKISAFRKRVISAFRQIAESATDENIAVVTHYGAISALLSYILKTDFDKIFHLIYISNASITILDYQSGKFSVCSVNDTCHLIESPGTLDEKPAGISAQTTR